MAQFFNILIESAVGTPDLLQMELFEFFYLGTHSLGHHQGIPISPGDQSPAQENHRSRNCQEDYTRRGLNQASTS